MAMQVLSGTLGNIIGPEQKKSIFGKIRYMSADDLGRKFNVERYVARVK